MISPESFALRWARLKHSANVRHGTVVADDGTPASAAETSAADAGAAMEQPEIAAAADTPFDPAGLPSIDAIDVDTDIRGFLQSGVPAELTRAALRQAWVNDPAIRDFIGIAENQWDFNDPDAMPGFGPLPEGYDVSDLLSQALGGRDRFAETNPKLSTSVERSPSAVTDREPADRVLDVPQSTGAELCGLPNHRSGETANPENNHVAEANGHPPDRRRHGSALPRHSES